MEKKKANKYFDRAITQCNELLQETNRREGRPVDMAMMNRQFEQFSDYTRRYCPFTHGVVSALVHFYTDIQDLTFDDNRLADADIGAYKFQGFLRCIKKLASYLLGCQIRLYMNLDDGQGGQNASDLVSLEMVSNIYTARMIEEQWSTELETFCIERNVSIEEKLSEKTAPIAKIGLDPAKYRFLIEEILAADEVVEKPIKRKHRKEDSDEVAEEDTFKNKIPKIISNKPSSSVMKDVPKLSKQKSSSSKSSQKRKRTIGSEDELLDTDEEKMKYDDDNDDSEIDWNTTDSEGEKDSPLTGSTKTKKSSSSAPVTPKLATTRSNTSGGSSSSNAKSTEEKKKKTPSLPPVVTPTPSSPTRLNKKVKPSSPTQEGRTDWDATDEEVNSTVGTKKAENSIFSASLGVVHSQLKSLNGLIDKYAANPSPMPTSQANRPSNPPSYNASYNSVVLSQNAIDDILNSLGMIQTGCERLSRTIKENATNIR